MGTVGRADPRYAVPLSAATLPVLRAYASRLLEHLTTPPPGRPEPALADVAFTLQTGRAAMSHRLVVCCDDLAGLRDGLEAFLTGRPDPRLRSSVAGAAPPQPPPETATQAAAALAWLSGQDVQWHARWAPGEARRVPLPTYPFADRRTGFPPAAAAARADDADGKRQRLEAYLRNLFAEVAGLPVADVSPQAPLDTYGLSSFLVAKLNARLERDLGETSRTLFFEYPDLAGVAGALLARPATSDRADRSLPNPSGADRRIAIIGIAGRYPCANDLGRFWANLADGRDCVTPLPPERHRDGWPVDLMSGGFLTDVDAFDPLLFGITPRDAALMDPQERFFLEVVWEALENAGYPRSRLSSRHGSRVAVYAGAMYNEYPFFGLNQALRGQGPESGSALGGIANRVSYHFDLHGPSMTVDTMCSSALTAVHLAVGSIRAGECEVAIAGAVNLSLHPNKFTQLHRMRMAAHDHRCRSFGHGGDGFVPAEGVGVVVLKPLDVALADGDQVRAVILGAAVAHGGKTNGYLVPSPVAQARVVRQAIDDAGVAPASIGYLEAHGTGTALGDPVEMAGLLRVFGDIGIADRSIPIGSVKSNIGHAESAAGLAGLTKVVLQMEHGILVPSLHAEELNGNIDWERTPFRVQRQLAEWSSEAGTGPDTPAVRRAGVSSFGAGGSIAHVVLESAPHRARTPGVSRPRLLVLSATDKAQLRALAARLAPAVAKTASADLADVAYTLQVGRQALPERLALAGSDPGELAATLRRFADGEPDTADPPIASGRAESEAASAGSGAGRDGTRPIATDAAPDVAALAAAGRHWVAGGSIDWPALYAAEPRQPETVGLASYPFARMRCWLPETVPARGDDPPEPPAVPARGDDPPEPPAVPARGDDPPTHPAEEEVPLYQRTWVKEQSPRASAGPPDGTVVCVHTASTEPLARHLAGAMGGQVLLVSAQRLEAEQKKGTRLVGLDELGGWIDLCDLAATGVNRWRERLESLRQVLAARPGWPLRVMHVCRGVASLAGPPPTLAGAEMAAFVRVLGTESVHVASTVLDTDVPLERPAEISVQICAEWLDQGAYGEVCYRAGQRYRPAFHPVAAEHKPLRLAPEAVYLVSGGTRGIGATVARHLVRHGARRLALLGAHPVPDRDRWDGPVPAGSMAAIATARRLEADGGQVMVHGGSLVDRDALSRFLHDVRRDLGAIAGVVHCAGRFSDGIAAFTQRDRDQVDAVLAPKMAGTEILYELCAGDPLEFFLLFSSVCAAVPRLAAGVLDYAAANAYLDYFHAYLARRGQVAVRGVNWPPWLESGSGTGHDGATPCARLGIGSLSDRQALRVLERVLAAPGSAVMLPCPPVGGPSHVMPDLDTLTQVRPPRSQVAPARPAAAASGHCPSRWLVELFSRTLGIAVASLDTRTHFGDLGVESVMLAELLQAIEARLGRPLPPDTLLSHPTLERLSAYLEPSEIPAPSRPVRQESARQESAEPVAIIGMAARLPGADDVDQFWASLRDAQCAITEVPALRWNHNELYSSAQVAGKSISKWGGFLDRIEYFDAAYFGMSDAEGTSLDPAIRLFMESVATCFADGGYRAADLAGQNIGVFVGGRVTSYGLRAELDQAVMTSGQNFIAAQVAHHFDLRGPALVVDSACSSALVGVHLAARSLLAGDCELAIAGGVEVLLDEEPYLEFSAGSALSPSGRCFAFDVRADGFVPGEGCGVVLLKPLKAALADGDRVLAIIEATTVNNDGRTMGVTTPSPTAQAELVRRALRSAGRSAEDIGMIEAHGTGTLIGDPIELQALTEAFRKDSDRVGWCGIGSVKSNIGHLLNAAGIAGLLKSVLSVRHGYLPATLFCQTPNPRFDFASSPFYPITQTRPWPVAEQRLAGVSSFGLGGTNAHVIVSDHRGPAGREPLPAPRFDRRYLWRHGDALRQRSPCPVASAPDRELVASLLTLDFR